MIAVHRAQYHTLSDKIEVAIVLQDDDGNALTSRLKEAVITLLHVGNTMRSVTIGPEHVVKQFDEDDEYTSYDYGEFYAFFLHPSAQRHLSVKMEVETIDGETATLVTPIEVNRVVSQDENQNPALPGHAIIEYPETVEGI